MKNETEKEIIKRKEQVLMTIGLYYNDLDSLCKRLQNDYNMVEDFEQEEQDRIALCNILDAYDYLYDYDYEENK